MTPVFDKIFKSAVKFCSKHSVEIAMGAAAVGVGLTIFTTAKATLKVNDIVHDDTLTKKEKVKKSVMPVAPAVGATALTYTALAAMYVFGRKKQAALLTLAMTTLQTFQTYRSQEQKRIGKVEELAKYDAAVTESNNLNDKVPDIPHLENEVIFCESITGQWFTGTKSNFWASAYAINGAFHEYGMAGFNQWLQFLGCDEDDTIDDVGFTKEGAEYYGYTNIEVGLVKHKSKSGKEYYLITYTTLPHSMFIYPYDKGCADEDLVLIPFYNSELWNNCSKGEMEGIIEHDIATANPRR